MCLMVALLGPVTYDVEVSNLFHRHNVEHIIYSTASPGMFLTVSPLYTLFAGSEALYGIPASWTRHKKWNTLVIGEGSVRHARIPSEQCSPMPEINAQVVCGCSLANGDMFERSCSPIYYPLWSLPQDGPAKHTNKQVGWQRVLHPQAKEEEASSLCGPVYTLPSVAGIERSHSALNHVYNTQLDDTVEPPICCHLISKRMLIEIIIIMLSLFVLRNYDTDSLHFVCALRGSQMSGDASHMGRP